MTSKKRKTASCIPSFSKTRHYTLQNRSPRPKEPLGNRLDSLAVQGISSSFLCQFSKFPNCGKLLLNNFLARIIRANTLPVGNHSSLTFMLIFPLAQKYTQLTTADTNCFCLLRYNLNLLKSITNGYRTLNNFLCFEAEACLL